VTREPVVKSIVNGCRRGRLGNGSVYQVGQSTGSTGPPMMAAESRARKPFIG